MNLVRVDLSSPRIVLTGSRVYFARCLPVLVESHPEFCCFSENFEDFGDSGKNFLRNYNGEAKISQNRDEFYGKT